MCCAAELWGMLRQVAEAWLPSDRVSSSGKWSRAARIQESPAGGHASQLDFCQLSPFDKSCNNERSIYNTSMNPTRMGKNGTVKGGCWDIPAFIVGCYGFYVYVQCFFPTFDVLCGGGFGYHTLPRHLLHDDPVKASALVQIEQGLKASVWVANEDHPGKVVCCKRRSPGQGCLGCAGWSVCLPSRGLALGSASGALQTDPPARWQAWGRWVVQHAPRPTETLAIRYAEPNRKQSQSLRLWSCRTFAWSATLWSYPRPCPVHRWGRCHDKLRDHIGATIGGLSSLLGFCLAGSGLGVAGWAEMDSGWISPQVVQGGRWFATSAAIAIPAMSKFNPKESSSRSSLHFILQLVAKSPLLWPAMARLYSHKIILKF